MLKISVCFSRTEARVNFWCPIPNDRGKGHFWCLFPNIILYTRKSLQLHKAIATLIFSLLDGSITSIPLSNSVAILLSYFILYHELSRTLSGAIAKEYVNKTLETLLNTPLGHFSLAKCVE